MVQSQSISALASSSSRHSLLHKRSHAFIFHVVVYSQKQSTVYQLKHFLLAVTCWKHGHCISHFWFARNTSAKFNICRVFVAGGSRSIELSS